MVAYCKLIGSVRLRAEDGVDHWLRVSIVAGGGFLARESSSSLPAVGACEVPCRIPIPPTQISLGVARCGGW